MLDVDSAPLMRDVVSFNMKIEEGLEKHADIQAGKLGVAEILGWLVGILAGFLLRLSGISVGPTSQSWWQSISSSHIRTVDERKRQRPPNVERLGSASTIVLANRTMVPNQQLRSTWNCNAALRALVAAGRG